MGLDVANLRANQRDWFKRVYHERVAAGLCPRCGKQPRTTEAKTCRPCSRAKRHRRAA
jgi:hypothetical protein